MREFTGFTKGINLGGWLSQFEEDSDLLESCIYYRESLEARYRYLLKKAKLNNIVITKTN